MVVTATDSLGTGRVVVPRSLRSRVLGSVLLPFPLPFGVVFAFIAVNGLAEGTGDVPPEDRLSPAGLVFTMLMMVSFAVGGLAIGIAEWRQRVTLTPLGIDVHNGLRPRHVPWDDVVAVEFCQISAFRGTLPAAAIVRGDGSRVRMRALLHAGRGIRQRQVDLLAATCAQHGVPVVSDGSWFWRRITLAGHPGGLRAARLQP